MDNVGDAHSMNDNGQLGIGSTNKIGDNPNEMKSYLQFTQAFGSPTTTPKKYFQRV